MFIRRPKVSICMRNYNYSHLIGKAIQSVLDQSYSDFELLIIDDCSVDNSEQVVKDFSDCRIKFHRNEKRLGNVPSLNKCLELAVGDYIAILDSDDMLTPGSLERRVNILNIYSNVGLVYSGIEILDVEIGTPRRFLPFDVKHIAHGEIEFKHLALLGNYIYWQTAMFRKNLFDELGKFDETIKYSSAWEMWLRMSLKCDVAYVPECLACKYEHMQNISANFNITNQIGMEEYGVLTTIFSSLPQDKAHLNYMKPLAKRSLAATMLRRGFRNLSSGRGALARRNAGLAVAIDDRVLLDWKLYVILLASLTGSNARLIRKLPLSLVLRAGRYRGWPRQFPCIQ